METNSPRDVKVYIGVPTAENARFAVFYDYLALLEKPTTTIGANFHTNSGAYNRNLIIDDAVANRCTHILFIDDDMAFPANSLMNLLKHDKDIVSGLFLQRNYPHIPAIFDLVNQSLSFHYLRHGESGLIEVAACGFGFTLIKTRVFQSIEKPYIRMGEVYKDKRGEDVGFCNRAREAGWKIYCDLDTIIGHIGVITYWPNNINCKWFTSIDTGGSEVFNIPQKTGFKPEIKTPLSYTTENDMYAHMLDLIDK